MKSKAAASHDDDGSDPGADIWEDKDGDCATGGGPEGDSGEELNDQLDRDSDNGADEDTSEDEDDKLSPTSSTSFVP